MDKQEIEVQVTLQSGTYYVADPCYVIADEDWLPWLEACDYTKNDTLIGKVPGTDIEAVGFRTAYGDGMYSFEGKNDRSMKYDDWTTIKELGVDSGMIGFVSSVGVTPSTPQFVQKVTFEHPCTITYREGNLSWITSRGEVFRILTEDQDGDW
jgi:hypothetical protein